MFELGRCLAYYRLTYLFKTRILFDMSDKARPRQRPLSPHLQIYKPQLTSVLSISHRISGAALAVGTLMVIWWLVAAAIGPRAYQTAMDFSQSWPGTAVLFLWSLALFYHLCNGIRHMVWDMGYAFKLKNAYRGGYIVMVTAIVLTIGTWWCALAYQP